MASRSNYFPRFIVYRQNARNAHADDSPLPAIKAIKFAKVSSFVRSCDIAEIAKFVENQHYVSVIAQTIIP